MKHNSVLLEHTLVVSASIERTAVCTGICCRGVGQAMSHFLLMHDSAHVFFVIRPHRDKHTDTLQQVRIFQRRDLASRHTLTMRSTIRRSSASVCCAQGSSFSYVHKQ